MLARLCGFSQRAANTPMYVRATLTREFAVRPRSVPEGTMETFRDGSTRMPREQTPRVERLHSERIQMCDASRRPLTPPLASVDGELSLPPAWRDFIRYCRDLRHGEIERLCIQDGLPVLAEVTTKKVKFNHNH